MHEMNGQRSTRRLRASSFSSRSNWKARAGAQRGAMISAAGAAAVAGLALATAVSAQVGGGAAQPTPLEQLARRTTSTMSNPYRLVEGWPTLPDGVEWGAAIGIIPDDTGGTWMLMRSEPPIHYIDASGKVTKSFGEGLFVQAHGFCMDRDG